jgi:hypothetical protein
MVANRAGSAGARRATEGLRPGAGGDTGTARSVPLSRHKDSAERHDVCFSSYSGDFLLDEVDRGRDGRLH